jgi:ribonuclease HI
LASACTRRVYKQIHQGEFQTCNVIWQPDSIKTLREPWPDGSLMKDFAEVELHEFNVIALANVGRQCEGVAIKHVYVDGSWTRKLGEAGFAGVILREDALEGHYLHGAFSGAVDGSAGPWNSLETLDQMSVALQAIDCGGMCPEKAGSLFAEALGVIWCLAWITRDDAGGACITHGDSAVAGHFAVGRFQYKVQQLLANVTRSLFRIIESQVELQRKHVKAHSGQPWNELADVRAKMA